MQEGDMVYNHNKKRAMQQQEGDDTKEQRLKEIGRKGLCLEGRGKKEKVGVGDEKRMFKGLQGSALQLRGGSQG